MRGLGSLAALGAVLAALAATGTASAHKPIPPGSVGYELTYTGLVYVHYKDSGSMQNANCPQLPNDQSPFSETDSVKVAWTTTWQFAFNPSGARRTSSVSAKSTILHGSNFVFSGTFDDANTCNPVKFGAQGPCTGILKNDGPGLLILNLTTARKNEDFVLNIEPFRPAQPAPTELPGQRQPAWSAFPRSPG